ncbi:hypothetical protein ACFE04_005819 [Oxalis oulophora]
MAGFRIPPEETELFHHQRSSAGPPSTTTNDLVSDDDRSVAADSWSIKSDYGSTLDDDQRHADAAEALASAANFPPASDDNSDKEDTDGDGIASMLGLQSYWDSAYTDELANFREHGHAGEVWFGTDVMQVVASWTKSLCINISKGCIPNHSDDAKHVRGEEDDKYLSGWSTLDVGTGNGLLLHALAKQGFSDLTGVDYSEGAIELAKRLADRDGFSHIKFLVDDVLETKLEQQFKLVVDKGTLDAIGLHPDGTIKRVMYWESVSKLVAPGGLLVITSCNHTKDELVQEVENFNQRKSNTFHYLNHVRSYPTFVFGGVVGSRVATVAFLRN